MMGTYGAFGGFAFIVALIYLLVIAFLLWLTYRFVKAHEKMADGVQRIEKHLSNRPKENREL